MKPILITVIFFSCFSLAKAQTTRTDPSDADKIEVKEDSTKSVVNTTDKIFTAVEHDPTFPGGLEAFNKFLMENIRYPAKSFEKHIQGKVFVTFTIEKDGSLNNIQV